MFERFGKDSKAVALAAREEAVARGSATLEAEHVLLALARDTRLDAGRVLDAAGLDPGGVEAALARELERSLAAVGVSASEFDLPEPALPVTGTPRWTASSKAVFERAYTIVRRRGDRRVTPTHLLLGALAADAGTVPRALDAAGVDRDELRASAEAMLDP